MPLQRMQNTVAMKLIAVPMLPMPVDNQRQRPVVDRVPRRECPLRQRRISKPRHIRRGARSLPAPRRR